ncbi:hypothetical protein [Fulvivirga lutea]|uniref:Uncharacterized protein n=1 Tax=Fulvivirga lutea TaxID=2810512 RepID=A0A974WGA4_9BACT|nr:hypothetical protein [Fulvivirga lutea]QSE96622.1 hypothetical protein JR347_13590 [Fulvivirga lutea]
MNRNKKIFLVFALIFFGIMIYIGYDISSKTTFPGSKSQLKERIQDEILEKDSSKSIKSDTIK